MTVHDWTRVEDNVFHDFHQRWITHLTEALNSGPLPANYIARCEQRYGAPVADLLTLREHDPDEAGESGPGSPDAGGVAVGVAPPRVRVRKVLQPALRTLTRRVVVRRVGDDRVVAVIDVVSPGNKDGRVHTTDFVAKLSSTLAAGVHVLVLDLLPPNRHTPGGRHMMLTDDFGIPRTGDDDEDGAQPPDRPVALLSYESDLPGVAAYIEYLRVGDPIPDLPLFLSPGRYVNVPLGPTYESTYRPMPRSTKAAL